MIPDDLLAILRCPETRQTLGRASAEVLAQANARLPAPVAAGLVRADGRVVYPIRDEIPVLLAEEAIVL